MFTLHALRTTIYEYKRIVAVAFIGLVLMVPTVYVAALKINGDFDKPKHEQILGTTTQSPQPSPIYPAEGGTPTPSPSPSQASSPTPRPTASPKISSPTPSPQPSPTSSPAASSSTAASSPSPSPSASSTPGPNAITIYVVVDSPTQSQTYPAIISQGQTAWEGITKAVGIGNIQYTDYGGDLGIFITGFNGINAAGNQFWEFKVNGVSSNVGVSSYICNNDDALQFVLTTF